MQELRNKKMNSIYGLIGNPVKHSFSYKFFNNLFDEKKLNNHSYKLYKLGKISEIRSILSNKEVKGLNITIPFKESVIDYLDNIDFTASKVGAVNCIKISTTKTIGYNTDIIGFEKSLRKFINLKTKDALILGSGGVSKAIEFILNKLEINYKIVSRNKTGSKYICYNDINKIIINKHKLIINATPLGTHPNINERPNIPYKLLSKNHYLYDLVYNPKVTSFLKEGIKIGCKTKNGEEMLKIQALESWKIWNS